MVKHEGGSKLVVQQQQILPLKFYLLISFWKNFVFFINASIYCLCYIFFDRITFAFQDCAVENLLGYYLHSEMWLPRFSLPYDLYMY